MKITECWLQEKSACSDGIDWFKNQSETDAIKLIEKLMIERKFLWANWLIVHVLSIRQCVRYSIFAAESVLFNFENKFPSDNRPRLAIESAKKFLAGAADSAAYSAAYSAYSAARAADSAAYRAAARAAYEKIIQYGISLFEEKN